jgi:hypothetical protein
MSPVSAPISVTESVQLGGGDTEVYVDTNGLITLAVIGSLFASTTSDFAQAYPVGEPVRFPFNAVVDAIPMDTTWFVPPLPTATQPLPVELSGIEPFDYWEPGIDNSVVLVLGVVDSNAVLDDDDLRRRFDDLAERWSRETEFVSVHARAIQHEAYRKIIDMGPLAVPWLLERLRDHPDHWLWALSALTGEDPAEDAQTFWEARDAWLAWGRDHGYLT